MRFETIKKDEVELHVLTQKHVYSIEYGKPS